MALDRRGGAGSLAGLARGKHDAMRSAHKRTRIAGRTATATGRGSRDKQVRGKPVHHDVGEAIVLVLRGEVWRGRGAVPQQPSQRLFGVVKQFEGGEGSQLTSRSCRRAMHVCMHVWLPWRLTIVCMSVCLSVCMYVGLETSIRVGWLPCYSASALCLACL